MAFIVLVTVSPWHVRMTLVFVYRQNEMQSHLVLCLEMGSLLSFLLSGKEEWLVVVEHN